MDKLKQYNSDSEEEENDSLLPDIPSEIFDKFHKAPSLPEDFYMFKRIIGIPPGYYNSFCSLEFRPARQQIEILNDIFTNLQMVSKMTSLFQELNINFRPLFQRPGCTTTDITDELHISLTGNIFLTKAAKLSFKELLQAKLNRYPELTSPNDNRIKFNKISLLRNQDGTRIFAALRITQESKIAIKPVYDTIVKSLNEVQARDPEGVKIRNDWIVNPELFHVSIADCTTHSKLITTTQLNELNEVLAVLDIEPDFEFSYDSLKMADGTSRISINIRL